jgi:hypothetical protein
MTGYDYGQSMVIHGIVEHVRRGMVDLYLEES